MVAALNPCTRAPQPGRRAPRGPCRASGLGKDRTGHAAGVLPQLGAAGMRHEKGRTQGPGPLVKIKS